MVLLKDVDGEPKKIVHALGLSSANYKKALDLFHGNHARTASDKENYNKESRGTLLRWLPMESSCRILLSLSIAQVSYGGCVPVSDAPKIQRHSPT